MSIQTHFSKIKSQICTIAGGANSDVERIPLVDGTIFYRKVMHADYTYWIQYEESLLSAINEKLPLCDSKYVVNNKSFSKNDGKDDSAKKIIYIDTYDAGVDLIDWLNTEVEIDVWLYKNIFCHPASLINSLKGCLQALHAVNKHQIVHLDIKANNICIPFHHNPSVHEPVSIDFADTALIDFGFSLWWFENPVAESIKFALGVNQEKAYQSNKLIEALQSNKRSMNEQGRAVYDYAQLKNLDYGSDLFAIGFLYSVLFNDYQQNRAVRDSKKWALIDQPLQEIIDSLLKFDDGLYQPFNLNNLPHQQLIARLDELLLAVDCHSSQVTFTINSNDMNLATPLATTAEEQQNTVSNQTSHASPLNQPSTSGQQVQPSLLAQISPLAVLDEDAEREEQREHSANANHDNHDNHINNASRVSTENHKQQISDILASDPYLVKFTGFKHHLEHLLKRDTVTAKNIQTVKEKLPELKTLDSAIQHAIPQYLTYFDNSVLNLLYSSFNISTTLDDSLSLLKKHIATAEKMQQANEQSYNNSYANRDNNQQSLEDKRRQLLTAEWNHAQVNHSIQGYNDFISRYPTTDYADIAHIKIGELEEIHAWHEASNQHNITGYTNFLSAYPHSQFVAHAKEHINDIQQKKAQQQDVQAEQQAWLLARKKDTIGSYKDFIKARPNSRNVTVAKDNIKDMQSKRGKTVLVFSIVSICSGLGFYAYSNHQAQECYYVAGEHANVRTTPSLKAATKLYQLNRNDKVCVTEKKLPAATSLKSVWYKIEPNSQKEQPAGWISSITLSKTKAIQQEIDCKSGNTDKYYVRYDSTILRSAQELTPENTVGFLSKNDLVCANKSSNQSTNQSTNGKKDWVQTTLITGQTALVQTKSLKPTTCVNVTHESGLNLRSRASKNSERTGWAKQYAHLCIVSPVNGNWAKVVNPVDRQAGYVSLRFTDY